MSTFSSQIVSEPIVTNPLIKTGLVSQPKPNGRKVNPEIINAIFNLIDKDSNGYLSRTEASSIFIRINRRLGRSYTQRELDKFFERLDVNRDGRINVEEYRISFNKWLA